MAACTSSRRGNRIARAIVALALLAAHDGKATESRADVHGYLLSLGQIYDGIYPHFRDELAAGVGGETARVTWRVRVERTSVHASGRSTSGTQVRVQELARTFALNDDWSLLVGKRVLSWDPSYSSMPLGFFQKRPDLMDITDSFGRAEGLPLAALSRFGESFDFTLVCGGDRGRRQFAANATWSANGGSYSLIFRKAKHERAGAGFSASATLSQSLTWHASMFARRRHLDAVVGGTWAPSPRTSIVFEWVRESNDHAHLQPDAPAGSSSLPGMGGSEHEFLFLRASHTRGNTNVAALMRSGLTQNGTIADLSISHAFGRHVAAGASVTWTTDGSMDSVAQIWVKYAFRVRAGAPPH